MQTKIFAQIIHGRVGPLIKLTSLSFLLLIVLGCAHKSRTSNSFGDVRTVLEVDALQIESNLFFAGWQEDSFGSYEEGATWMTPYENMRQCAFGLKTADGLWRKKITRRHPDYSWGGNPSVLKTKTGTLVAVCMSADAPFLGRGLLEFSYSQDKGETWSDWKVLYKNEQGSPDKPVLFYGEKSDSFGVAFVDFQVESLKEVEYFGKKHNQNYLRGQLSSRQVSFTSKGEIKYQKIKRHNVPGFKSLSKEKVFGHYTVEVYSPKSGPVVGVLTGRASGDIVYFFRISKKGKWSFKPLFPLYVHRPVCRMAGGENKKLAMLCYHAHLTSQIVLFSSLDGGVSWLDPKVIEKKGELGNVVFGKDNNILLVWKEVLAEGVVQTYRQTFSSRMETLSEKEVIFKYNYNKQGKSVHGAYQDLLWDSKKSQFHAFIVGTEKSLNPSVQHKVLEAH